MDKDSKADAAIRDHMGYAVAAGAIPVPWADIAAVTLVQRDLVAQLAEIYGQKYDATWGKATVAALSGATLARAAASMAKAAAGVGTVIGAGTQMVLSGASTYAVGKLFKAHFSAEGTIDTFNPEEMKAHYEEYLEKGKGLAHSFRSAAEPATVHSVAETLERMSRLRIEGVLSDTEFERMKERLLETESG